ncbi:fibronectin type III domain-containing protein [Spongiactinospora sp. TRM90649]|uniref:fibronectin type III domain-containing protein n=1 Tax=Spongiactinospora sp. TRM90649 TaxID=3031114 RepID=UPI0023F8CA03|nr:fibronectin type III domain-containing protein [Spongiactinospora sp. TRM90649]MDF5756666.1 fibronectin type III domain-containing protein [Spongiactinospora sp. TRM90649]
MRATVTMCRLIHFAKPVHDPKKRLRHGGAMFELRLAVHVPSGDRLGPLPHPLAFEAGWPLGDVPALKLTSSGIAAGGDLLSEPCEVAVEWSQDGAAWTEAPDSRFLLIKRRKDGADRAAVSRFELPGWIWQLRKAVLYPGDAPLVGGKRAFLSATPGAILQTMLSEAQTRGAVPGVVWDFTPTIDSNGDPWAKILTISYQPGMDTLTVLINLHEQGVCDFRTLGRTVQVFNPDTELGRDLATVPAPVDLRLGRDVVEAPQTGTLEDRASAVLVVGDNGFREEYTSPAHGPWGRWETYIGHGGVSDPGTAALLAESALARAGAERVQRTCGITITPGTRWLPWRDYRPGDRILAPGEGGMASMRVRQMTLTRDQRGVLGGSLVLNDRLLEREIRLARRTSGIVGGSTATGGSGAQPAPEAPAPRTPAAPGGLIVDPTPYIDEAGFPRGQITAAWGVVTADVNGVALDVGGYELFMRVNEVGALWFLVAVTEADDLSVTFSPLVIGQQYQFKVRAVNLGKRGPFSGSVAVTVPDDTDAPPVPTAPVLATRLGVVHVEWDGMGAGAAPMPTDFHRVVVEMQDPLAPGWSEIGYLEAAGSIVVPGLPYGQDREFSFTAIDRSGNASAQSVTATIATAPLVLGDAANSSIATGNLVANAVTASKIAAGAVEASHIAANAVTAAKLEAVLTLTTRLVAGNPSGARVELRDTGLAAFDGGGMQTVSISSASGAVTIIGQLATGTIGRRIVVNPAGAADPEVRFYPGSGVNYARIWTDTDAAIRLYSGTSPDGTRRSEVIQRGDEWRMHMVQSSDGLAGGGYMFAQPERLEVGYNDIGGRLNRWLFAKGSELSSGTGYTQFRGTFHYDTGAGLAMFARNLTTPASSHFVAFNVTLQSTPRLVITADNPSPSNLIFHVASPSTTGFTLRSHLTGGGTTFITLLYCWIWRQHGVA